MSVSMLHAQTPEGRPDVWTMMNTRSEASLRGLSVVTPEVVWASGSAGTVLRTVDGGKSWKNVGPKAFPEADFRSLHAFSADEAIIASAGETDVILRTRDGGDSWDKVYEYPRVEDGKDVAFFDDIIFVDAKVGFLLGDPVEGRMLMLHTTDGGRTWARLELQGDDLKSSDGEAAFAASGSNMCAIDDETLVVGLGGHQPGKTSDTCHVWRTDDLGKSWNATTAPIARSETSGIFAINAFNPRRLIAVGGDYRDEQKAIHHCAISVDGGLTWIDPTGDGPGGFRSAVACTSHDGQLIAVAVGPSGADLSVDGGQNWSPISSEGFHAAAFANDGQTLWASGAGGRIGRTSVGQLTRK
jgi:photosystem II stability/assembly factor-like uncharacterized protein